LGIYSHDVDHLLEEIDQSGGPEKRQLPPAPDDHKWSLLSMHDGETDHAVPARQPDSRIVEQRQDYSSASPLSIPGDRVARVDRHTVPGQIGANASATALNASQSGSASKNQHFDTKTNSGSQKNRSLHEIFQRIAHPEGPLQQEQRPSTSGSLFASFKRS